MRYVLLTRLDDRLLRRILVEPLQGEPFVIVDACATDERRLVVASCSTREAADAALQLLELFE